MATRTKNGAHATATKRTQELLATGRVGSVPQLIFGDLWEYDPAPESADPKIKPRYDLFIGGKFVAPKSGKYFDSINPATEKVLSSVPIANAEDVDDAYKAAQKAFEGHWGRMRSSERGKYIYRIARLIQDRAREFAVAETMDGGKPIKESRDFDVPMAAAHFFYHAGWADKLDYAFPGAHAKPLGVVGSGNSVEFPAADARVENCACACNGKLRCAEACRDDVGNRIQVCGAAAGS
jgi:aldehyde dehydrogenase (NAD+)